MLKKGWPALSRRKRTWNRERRQGSSSTRSSSDQLQIQENQDLERILKELTAELESRTELGMDAAYSSGVTNM
ncbi:leucine zipper putative tumor suppressor 1 [Lates japonicus]|uniref:Leucine zipper putative tumor suppressor 1 n=1 Tax=Lates japonicus TaxID=270547 RepID=A0AAD3NEM5_LATJO|nr:leucine zipper putative tumor suppressor 1 [Lates japonicus]